MLHVFQQWSIQNCMQINTDKTKIVYGNRDEGVGEIMCPISSVCVRVRKLGFCVDVRRDFFSVCVRRDQVDICES